MLDQSIYWYDKEGYIEFSSKTINRLNLVLNDNEFSVFLRGKDAAEGVVIVALYDKADGETLLEARAFDVASTSNITGAFNTSGLVRAYWWKNFNTMIPLCECVQMYID